MGDIGGPLIILMLGIAAGALFHNAWRRRFWTATALATVAATALWIGGCYLLFVLTAPSELGPPLLIPVLLTIVTALAGAMLAGGANRMVRAR